ncbi:MAG: hypothetical protein JWO03_2250 [Bacteroidetes bacterium]|nr:hypothetical protein [Bacteroidota bacterium]
MAGLFTAHAQLSPFVVNGPSGATGAQQIREEDLTGSVAIGINGITGPIDCSFGVSNQSFSTPPNIISIVANKVNSSLPSSGISPVTFVAGRFDPAYTGPGDAGVAIDFSVDGSGGVGVGAPPTGVFPMTPRFGLTDNNNSTAPLMTVLTGTNTATSTNLTSFNIDHNGLIGIGTEAPASNLTVVTGLTSPAATVEIINRPYANSYATAPYGLIVSRQAVNSGGGLGPPYITYSDLNVTSDGLTGMGVASPAAHLDITDQNSDNMPLLRVTPFNVTTPAMYIKDDGLVGIGTASPATQLQVYGSGNLLNIANSGGSALYVTSARKIGIGTTSPTQALQVNGTTVTTNLQITNGATSGYVLQSDGSGNGSWVDLATIDGLWAASGTNIHNTNTGTVNITGKLVIGSDKPVTSIYNGFKLSVDGTIIAKECYIQIDDWADNVFDKDYVLKDLSYVKEYIKSNKHLPEIPSECDVLEKGVAIGDMNKLLLKKLEELTLYVIELKEENNQIRNIVSKIKK